MVTEHTAASTKMRAIVQTKYGDSGDLHLDRIDVPDVADDEALVRVHAAGLDRGTWHLMTGKPYVMRIAGMGFKGPKDRVPGRDLAGVVEAVGSAVTRFAIGEEVYGIGRGTFAEHAVAPEDKLAHKPARLSFEQAAVVPISAGTALQALTDQGHLEAGQSVLVIGASGGVGTFAVQIAKASGAHVTGVSSTEKLDLVRSLGADDVVDYRTTDVGTLGRRFDVVLDIGGNRRLRTLRRLLTPTGTLVIVGGEDGGQWLGMGRQVLALLLSPFVPQSLRMFVASENAADLAVLTELIEAGKVTPTVDRSFPLAETAAAVAHMSGGKARGKVAVTV